MCAESSFLLNLLCCPPRWRPSDNYHQRDNHESQDDIGFEHLSSHQFAAGRTLDDSLLSKRPVLHRRPGRRAKKAGELFCPCRAYPGVEALLYEVTRQGLHFTGRGGGCARRGKGERESKVIHLRI